jgi:hypothetical protein
MKVEQHDSAISELLTKCLVDETFKQQLITDPVATLAAAGFPDPANIQASTEFKRAIMLLVHSITHEGELSDLQLSLVAGGNARPSADPRRSYGSG